MYRVSNSASMAPSVLKTEAPVGGTKAPKSVVIVSGWLVFTRRYTLLLVSASIIARFRVRVVLPPAGIDIVYSDTPLDGQSMLSAPCTVAVAEPLLVMMTSTSLNCIYPPARASVRSMLYHTLVPAACVVEAPSSTTNRVEDTHASSTSSVSYTLAERATIWSEAKVR